MVERFFSFYNLFNTLSSFDLGPPLYSQHFSKLLVSGDFHDKTPPGTVQVLTSSSQETPQLFDPSHSDTVNNDVHDSEGGDANGDLLEEQKDVDPLDQFLPPPPKAKCSEELQVSSLQMQVWFKN